MRLTYYGHSCFEVETNGKKLLFDPFISGNPQAKDINIADLEPDYILVSHGHGDHIADCAAIAQGTDAMVISTPEVCKWLKGQKVQEKNLWAMNTGGTFPNVDFVKKPPFTVKMVAAQHSSNLPDGSYGGNPVGFLVQSKEGNFYYSGDTALTLDMQLIPKWAKLNFAVLPIGDNFTMGYEDAARAARMIRCKHVVGVHYDTFEDIRIKKKKEAIDKFKAVGCKLHLPGIGKAINL